MYKFVGQPSGPTPAVTVSSTQGGARTPIGYNLCVRSCLGSSSLPFARLEANLKRAAGSVRGATVFQKRLTISAQVLGIADIKIGISIADQPFP
jgi:hypothetical protein